MVFITMKLISLGYPIELLMLSIYFESSLIPIVVEETDVLEEFLL